MQLKPSLKQKDLSQEFTSDLLKDVANSFYNELKEASDAYQMNITNKTSLPFIVSEVPTRVSVADGEIFQVFVMGGTMGKKAICKKIDGVIEIVSKKEREIPVLNSANDFFTYMFEILDPQVAKLVINFAYPIAPQMNQQKLDGILLPIMGEKTFKANDLVGKPIGKELEKYFKTKNRIVEVSVVNDTVCLLLSARKKRNGHIGCGIVGTGLNFGFALSDNQMVNLESAEFNKFSPSNAGEYLADKKIGSPFGREVNGKLLYYHFNLALTTLGIDFPSISSTIQLQSIAEQDIPIISQLAKAILTKSAQLVACQAAAIARFKQSDMKFVMEGGLFWGASSYKKVAEQTAREILPEYKVSFIRVYESGILGAAKAIASE